MSHSIQNRYLKSFYKNVNAIINIYHITISVNRELDWNMFV